MCLIIWGYFVLGLIFFILQVLFFDLDALLKRDMERDLEKKKKISCFGDNCWY